jgi:tetratricopeptide (TPR) repeat protein
MKRCPYCGAKNKDAFEFCVRCSAAIDEEVVETSDSPSKVSTLFAFVALALFTAGFLLLWQRFQTSENENPQSAAPRATVTASAPDTSAPPLAPFDVERAQSSARAGMVAYHQGHYEKAARLFEEFVLAAPNNPFGHMYLGLSYYRLDERDPAIDAMSRAFDLAPGNPGFGTYMVGMLMQQDDFTAAEEIVRRYLETSPDDENARLELVRLMRRQGGIEEASAEAERLVADSPENFNAILELGACLKESGDLAQAGTMFRRAVEMDPESAAAQHALGVSESLSGKYEQALQPLEAAVRLDPENGLYRLALAQAYEKTDYIEDSFEEYEAFLKHSPDDPRAPKIREALNQARKAMKILDEQERKGVGETP